MAMQREVSNYIPDDVAFKILTKLPVKSLKRFSCVCKSYSILFENPQFMSLYRKDFLFKDDNHNSQILLKKTKEEMGGIFEYDDFDDGDKLYLLSGETFENSVKLDWPPPFESHVEIFIASTVVNGILCLYQGHDWGLQLKVLLWNPATAEFKVIPPSSFVLPPSKVIPPKTPDDSPVVIHTCVRLHGFGYEPMTDDYKLIRYASYPDSVEEDDTNVSILWEIYSLRSNCWRKLSVEMPNQMCMWKSRDIDFAVYVNQVCHWIGYEDFNLKEGVLVSFNLSNEDFIITPINHRDAPYSQFDSRFLMELKGSIAMITFYDGTKSFDISILGELGVTKSWTKVYCIGTLPDFYEELIGVGEKGNICFNTHNYGLIWFDVTAETAKNIGVYLHQEWSQVIVYKESLLPIGGINV